MIQKHQKFQKTLEKSIEKWYKKVCQGYSFFDWRYWKFILAINVNIIEISTKKNNTHLEKRIKILVNSPIIIVTKSGILLTNFLYVISWRTGKSHNNNHVNYYSY